jgi:hypothetical protein
MDLPNLELLKESASEYMTETFSNHLLNFSEKVLIHNTYRGPLILGLVEGKGRKSVVAECLIYGKLCPNAPHLLKKRYKNILKI